VRPPQKRNNRPAVDEKITDAKVFHKLANGLGLDAWGEQWWAEHAPEVETGRVYAVDGEEGIMREQRALERRERAQCGWLLDHDILGGDALREALSLKARHEREDLRREQMAREAREDRWYR